MFKNKENTFEQVYNIIKTRRSIRRFKQISIDIDFLKKIADAGRLAPSAANLQPLEFFIVNDKLLCSRIFDTIGWAAYLKPKWRPIEKERPTAYIVILVNDTSNKYYLRDVSLATENIVIAAEAKNVGSCIICNVNRDRIREVLKIPKNLSIDSIIAFGYKSEHPVVVDYIDNVEYWRDENQILYVPKRKLENIIHINKY